MEAPTELFQRLWVGGEAAIIDERLADSDFVVCGVDVNSTRASDFHCWPASLRHLIAPVLRGFFVAHCSLKVLIQFDELLARLLQFRQLVECHRQAVPVGAGEHVN